MTAPMSMVMALMTEMSIVATFAPRRHGGAAPVPDTLDGLALCGLAAARPGNALKAVLDYRT